MCAIQSVLCAGFSQCYVQALVSVMCSLQSRAWSLRSEHASIHLVGHERQGTAPDQVPPSKRTRKPHIRSYIHVYIHIYMHMAVCRLWPCPGPTLKTYINRYMHEWKCLLLIKTYHRNIMTKCPRRTYTIHTKQILNRYSDNTKLSEQSTLTERI